MSAVRERSGLTIEQLPQVVRVLIERAGGAPPALEALHISYLRRKPGRGMTAVYRISPAAGGQAPTGDPALVHLGVGEHALSGGRIAFPQDRLDQVELQGRWPGIIHVPELGFSLQSFPADPRLPALPEVFDLQPGREPFGQLETAVRDQLDDRDWRLAEVSAEPLRYKPGDRCVLRYRMLLDHPHHGRRSHSLVGKVYADPAQAARVFELTSQLYDSQLAEVGRVAGDLVIPAPLLPRPLCLVAGLGLILSEHATSPGGEPARAGTELLRQRAEVPGTALLTTAVCLARLHTSAVAPGILTLRGAGDEAGRARKRAAALADHAPELGDRSRALAGRLAVELERGAAARPRPSHGSFKSAQLLFPGPDQVVVTDFDQLCLADPALDVGYFLAYLRPAALWYGRAGMREWFEAAAAVLAEGYRRAMLDLGAEPDELDGVLRRSHLYQAALIFKIANRRPNRLNSPRPAELTAMLDEIERCVAAGATAS
jgi:hypothetical protein